jgi:pyridoxine 5-phosphate synthase
MANHVRLSVNLNKIALLRNSRRTGAPDVLEFAALAYGAGCDGVTVHPRPDERHITHDDVHRLAEWASSLRPKFELNIESYPDDALLDLVSAISPEQCTLVPDRPTALTSDEGWRFDAAQQDVLARYLPALAPLSGRIILFADSDPRLVRLAAGVGADGIEIYTGKYAAEHRQGRSGTLLDQIASTADEAIQHGLCVNVGHDLNLQNVPALLERVPDITEASIGHELTVEDLRVGFRNAVAAYKAALTKS